MEKLSSSLELQVVSSLNLELDTILRKSLYYSEKYDVIYKSETNILLLIPSYNEVDEEWSTVSLYDKLHEIETKLSFIGDVNRILKGEIQELLFTELILYENKNIGIILRLQPKSDITVIPVDVPLEIWLEITKRLDYNNTCALYLTDKSFSNIYINQNYWRELLSIRFKKLSYPTDIPYDYKKIHSFLYYSQKNHITILTILKMPEHHISIIPKVLDLVKYKYRKVKKSGKTIPNISEIIKFISIYSIDYDFLKEFLEDNPIDDGYFLCNLLQNIKLTDDTVKEIVINSFIGTLENESIFIDPVLNTLSKFFSKDQLLRILKISKVDDGNKVIIIRYIIETDEILTFNKLEKDMISYIDNFDKDLFLAVLFSSTYRKNFDIMKGLIEKYANLITAEDISHIISRKPYDPEITCWVFNLDIMRKRYLKE